MVHAVSRRPVTTETRVRYVSTLWRSVIDVVEVGQVFL
jgi:hypothetical protein